YSSSSRCSHEPTINVVKVDDLLNGRTLDELVTHVNTTTRGKAKKDTPKPRGQPKNDARYATDEDDDVEETEEDTNSDGDYKNSEFEDVVPEGGGSYEDDDDDYCDDGVREDVTPSQKVGGNKRQKTAVTSVSSNDSSRSTTMRQRKEEHRVRDATDQSANGAASHKLLLEYKQKFEMLTKENKQKDKKIEQLGTSLEDFCEKFTASPKTMTKPRNFCRPSSQILGCWPVPFR
ncbi:MAG: hypothetical protein ACRCZI_01995, partial [Cetobacterium sp.]